MGSRFLRATVQEAVASLGRRRIAWLHSLQPIGLRRTSAVHLRTVPAIRAAWSLNNFRNYASRSVTVEDELLEEFVSNDVLNADELFIKGKELLHEGQETTSGEKVRKGFLLVAKAAVLENPQAQTLLSVCYAEGMGVAHSPTAALDWAKKAASNGQVEGMIRTSKFLKEGTGVRKDLSKAYKYIQLALARERTPEILRLSADFLFDGKGVRKDQAKAFQLYLEAAELGDAEAMLKVAECYRRGTGVQAESTASMKWYRQAADADNAHAAFRLGVAYQRGTNGVDKDVLVAYDWLEKAASFKHAQALFEVACCLERGIGVKADLSRALTIFEELAIRGNARAQVRLGKMYERGIGTTRRPLEAMEWYRRAALRGNVQASAAAEAAYRYARFFDTGTLVERDPVTAIYWYEKAKSLGSKNAEERISALSLMEQEHSLSGGQDSAQECGKNTPL